MNPTYDFSGQVALITGAASGLGRATAKAFAEFGAAEIKSSGSQPSAKGPEELVYGNHQDRSFI